MNSDTVHPTVGISLAVNGTFLWF